jgi:vacuolar-type H+-ATPase subunit E/Vma4
MTDNESRQAALAPLRASLLARANSDAERMRRVAEADGEQAVAAALVTSKTVLTNARAQGAADAAALLADERARGRRAARGIVLAAQRAAFDELRKQVGQEIQGLLADPALRDRLSGMLREQLGATANVRQQGSGGLLAQSPDGRRIDASVTALVDLALADLDVERLWTAS